MYFFHCKSKAMMTPPPQKKWINRLSMCVPESWLIELKLKNVCTFSASPLPPVSNGKVMAKHFSKVLMTGYTTHAPSILLTRRWWQQYRR